MPDDQLATALDEAQRIAAAFLADVRMQADDHHLVPAAMVYPLLGAVEAVLKLAADAREVRDYSGPTLAGRLVGWDLDPARVREAITRELAKGEATP